MADDDEPDHASLLAAREKETDALLASGKTADALRRALANPPFASKDEAVKDRSAACVLKALVAIGSRDEALNSFFENIDADVADSLMKVVVKGFARPENATLLLKMHALLVEKAGIACLVRAIVDRKTA